MVTRQEVAEKLDHAVLKPFATDTDVEQNARMCVERGVGCLCVRPSDVAKAEPILRGSNCLLAIVVGFPHGSNLPEVKALETRLAVEAGVKEVDMVMNIGKFLSGDEAHVRRDVEAVVAEAKPKGVPVKVILETCWLNPEQIERACRICEEAGADFVKTSTGFGDGPATPEAVDVMLKTVGKTMGVKASGGIRNWETSVAYLEQGCHRLGVASAEAILDGAPE